MAVDNILGGGALREKIRNRIRPPAFLAVAAGIIVSILLWFAGSGLFAYLTSDDARNIYLAWRKPYYRILLENVAFFTPAYRPMGTLFYRLLFDIAGLNALPYRIICFALIIFNLYLLYRTAAAISMPEIGLLAALFGSYNAGFVDLYRNTGTIYDLLCFAFYFLALLLYVSARKKACRFAARKTIAFLLLYACALNSKEAAVTLPVVLVVYELLFVRVEYNFQTSNYLVSRWTPAILSGALTILVLFGKLSAGSPLAGNDAYRLHLGLRTYFRALRHYLETLTGAPGSFSMGLFLATFAMLAFMTIFARRRCLIFALLFFFITILPVAFIEVRGGYAIYIPSFGIALFMAQFIVECRRALAWVVVGDDGIPAPQTRRLLQFDTFLFCLIILVAFHRSRPLGEVSAADNMLRSLVSQLRGTQPRVAQNSRVLILDDPTPEDYAVLFILRLYYRAPDLEVDRAKTVAAKPTRGDFESYDRIFAFNGGSLVRVKP